MYYNKIPIYPIFYLVKGDYSPTKHLLQQVDEEPLGPKAVPMRPIRFQWVLIAPRVKGSGFRVWVQGNSTEGRAIPTGGFRIGGTPIAGQA